MKIAAALGKIESVEIAGESAPVFHSAAIFLAEAVGANVAIGGACNSASETPGVLRLVDGEGDVGRAMLSEWGVDGEGVYLCLTADGSGVIAATKRGVLYGFIAFLLRQLADDDLGTVENGRLYRCAFDWQRSLYDFFLNQEARIQRNLDRESYIRQAAKSGFTHLEVNGLAFPMGLETGPKGETYPMFYTYCPALDQFVYSSLNRGLYPHYYLAANLRRLKDNARLAVKYGMQPGLMCFEPRSVPEEFFSRYPMLRGARVDHPFRSFKPRYNMTITHPRVREHYAEMMTKLMKEVPELGFLSIWTNDSGAGFEYTNSLYVGRNGGPYLIREWKDAEAIAEASGENALRFMRVLRDAGTQVNPEFRVITRMESFYGEHDVIWRGFEKSLEVESASLVARGWEMPYSHPSYPDSKAVNGGSVYQRELDPGEVELAEELTARSSRAHFYFTAGPQAMFAPLLGVPYPTLTWERLKLLSDNGIRHIAHLGGTCSPEQVPFNVNHEIVNAFQYGSDRRAADVVGRLAVVWAGEKLAARLVKAWALAEEAILAYPNITPLYSGFGFAWYRLWARPLVPNIEAIPAEERAYYEDFMCTTPHNPNNVDLSRDVLFELTTEDNCRRDLERMDENVWEPMDRAIAVLKAALGEAEQELGEGNVIVDQCIRLRAFRCWLITQRNVAAWIAGVHGYLRADTEGERDECRGLLREMMTMETANSRELKELLSRDIEFMATTDQGETPLMYGDNLAELLDKRIALMERHMDEEPYIDPDYIERNAGKMLA